MKSPRFERKGQSGKNRKITEDIALTPYRANDAECGFFHPVLLGSVKFDHIRSFHNLEAYPHVFESDLDIVQWACALAGESPTARLLLKEAQSEGWAIRMDDLAQDGFMIDTEARVVHLDHYGFTAAALGKSAYFRNAVFVNFIKALRRLWHDARNDFRGSHRPDAVLLFERAQAADCETIAILTGWELRGEGHADVWRSILGSEEGDMAMIFTRAIEKDPAGFYDGSVLTRTFCQWYGDEARVAACDHATLENMDNLVEEARGAPVFGKAPATGPAIEAISGLPSGRAYLEGMGANICADPYFVSLNDAINESHLFQIVYDSKVVMIEGVPFRDQRLARMIFPGARVTVRD